MYRDGIVAPCKLSRVLVLVLFHHIQVVSVRVCAIIPLLCMGAALQGVEKSKELEVHEEYSPVIAPPQDDA